MTRLLASIVIVGSWGMASAAWAQCAEGRTTSEATAGRCCWPAQRWNADAARCEGPPSCPAGRVAAGDDCAVAATVPVAPVATPVIVHPLEASYIPAAADLTTETTFHEPTVIAGTTVLVTGYVYSVIVGGVFIGGGGYMSFIPVIGGLLWLIPYLPYGLYFGIAGSLVQIAGLITLIVGLVDRVPVTRDVASGGGPTLTA